MPCALIQAAAHAARALGPVDFCTASLIHALIADPQSQPACDTRRPRDATTEIGAHVVTNVTLAAPLAPDLGDQLGSGGGVRVMNMLM